MDRNRFALGGVFPLLFLLIFFFYPLAAIFELSFADGNILAVFQKIFSSAYYRKILWFSIWQAGLSTGLTLLLALPAAHIFSRFDFPAKSLILNLATLPFVLPTVVVATAFRAWLGGEESLRMILLAHVFYNYAVALRIISSFWANQHPRYREAAWMLGGNRARVFWRITLPLLMPAVWSAGLLVFMFTFTSFGVILLLGGFRYATLEVEIYIQATALFNLPVASALSILQLGMTLLMLIVYGRLQSRLGVNVQAAKSRRPHNWQEWLWIGINLAVILLLVFAPLLALVSQSFLLGGNAPSLRYYNLLDENTRGSRLFVAPIEALKNSLRFAALTTLFALILGTQASYLLKRNRWLDPILMLPLATSAVTLGFGFIIALDEAPLNLRNSFWIIPIAHTLVAMPFVVRVVSPTLNGISPSILEAAQVAGVSRFWQWWRIDLPLLARSLGVGATFAFTISMGEFGASVFLNRAQEPTLPFVIFRLLGQPGLSNYGQALALSVILLCICLLSFGLIQWLNHSILGKF